MATLGVGSARLSRIEETVETTFRPEEFFLAYNTEEWQANMNWLAPRHFNPAAGTIYLSMHSWVVRTGRHTVLVDTCIGNHKDRMPRAHWHMQEFPYLDRLAAAGIRVEEIDFVMCTHLHPDHVGWNTRLQDGRWVPTFPNAKYLFGQKEYDYWLANPSPVPTRRNAIEDSVLPIIEAGRAVMFNDGHQVDDCFTVEMSPGHAPGHACFRLHSDGEQALFTGDAIHHPIQVRLPHWSTSADTFPKQAEESRRAILAHAAEHNTLLLPAHFVAPHAGHVRWRDGGYVFDFLGE